METGYGVQLLGSEQGNLMGRITEYDELAATYASRYTHSRMEGVQQALQQQVQQLPAACVLEAGCGTGYWLMQLPSRATRLFGLDYSRAMLLEAHSIGEQAQKLVMYQHGSAMALPYASSSFDLVFTVNAMHHFNDPQRFICESFRVLKPGGTLSVFGSFPQRRRESWFVYQFFDGVYERDLQRFHAAGTILKWARAAEFDLTARRLVHRISDTKHGSAVLDDPFLVKTSCSQLAMLTDEEYEQGLARIKAVIAKTAQRGSEHIFQVKIDVDLITAQKPV